MTPAARNVLLNAPFNPYRLSGNAAVYSLEGSPSDSTYLIDGSNRLMLVADRSGNSSVNGLVLNGASGNYASAVSSAALQITGDIDLRADAAMDSWTPSAESVFISKWGNGGTTKSYLFSINTNGTLKLYWSTNGTAQLTATSTSAVSFAAFARGWVRAILDVDNGASGYTATFYTSNDGSTWTQLGNTVTSAGATSITTQATGLELGSYAGTSNLWSGKLYRTQIYNGIGGTLVFDSDFTRAAKLASSFTESSSNAATVTINTSGATGARICGARDLYQGTQANQPIFSVSSGRNIATFDGSDDHIRSATFSLSQPTSVYFTGSQLSWTNGATWFDGNTNDRMGLQQHTSTPNLDLFAGGYLGLNGNLPLATRGVLRVVANGTNSSLGVNLLNAITGNAGTNNAGGFIIGRRPDGTNPANIAFSDAIVRSVADDATLQLKIAGFQMRKGGVS